MIGDNFTDRVRKVLRYAREEAVRLRHEYIGPEHVLLGLLREGQSVGAALLVELNVSPDALRAQVEATVKPGKPGRSVGPDLAYSSHGMKVLEYAMAEAHELGYSYVGTDHLLLGLLRCHGSRTADVLAAAGLTLDQTRAAALRLRGPE